MNSQRGLSGTWRRTSRMPTPRIAPEAKASRQPRSDWKIEVSRRNSEASAAETGADPEAAVDGEVHLAAVARGDQLVDGRVDRGVLPADAHAGQEAAEEEVPGVEGERGRDGGGQVEPERGHEQLLAPVAVGELAEEQRADAGAGDVERSGRPDVGGAHVDAAARLGQARGDRADDRHLEPVEDPDGPEADDDPPVEARPRQAVQAGRDVGPDRLHPGRCDAHRAPPAVRSEVDAPLSRAGPSLPLLERRPDDALGVPARLRRAWLEARIRPRRRPSASPARSTARTGPISAAAHRSACSRCACSGPGDDADPPPECPPRSGLTMPGSRTAGRPGKRP